MLEVIVTRTVNGTDFTRIPVGLYPFIIGKIKNFILANPSAPIDSVLNIVMVILIDEMVVWQGLDPRATANLFIDAVCIGEKIINEEDCFILKLDTSQSALEAQSGPKYEIIHHTIWGYFSQRSGLLVKFEDSRLLSVKSSRDDGEGVFWETSTESVIEEYKYVEGVNIAHSGKTFVTVFRYGEQSANHKRELQEKWKIEEVDFNIFGLSNDFFLPPTEFKK